jgi:arylformamidase
MKIYDITAEISDNLPVYGKERPVAEKSLQLAKGDMCNLMNLSLTTHTGTHADMPSHFILGGATCDNIPLDHFYGKAKLIRVNAAAHITKEDLQPFNIEAGIILLIDTGQSPYMRQRNLKEDYLALMPCAAQYLVEKKIKTVGIDYLSIDPYNTADFAAHKILLGSGVTVLEGLVLENVPEGEYILSALPLKIADGDGSPVRAVLVER